MHFFIKNFMARSSRNRRVARFCFLFLLADLLFLNSCIQPLPQGRPGGLLTASENSEAHASPVSENKSAPASDQPAMATQKSTSPSAAPVTRVESPSHSLDLPIVFKDGFGKDGLKKAIRNQLRVMQGVNEFDSVRLENLVLTKGDLKNNLEAFLDLLNQNLPPEEFNRRVRNEFTFFKAGQGRRKKFLFTGYYTPVIQASPVQTKEYIYPIYRIPDDSVTLSFVGHPTKNHLQKDSPGSWKDLTRRQIDHLGVLKNQNLEIAWLKDDLERFFLHIQGSGVLEFADGTRQGVRFAGANKYGYQGIGKLMVKDGLLGGKGERSMQGIKKYLRDHPADIPKYLYQNKRYIYFAYTDQGPQGSGGGELVGGRSIATDKSIYPAGGLALILVRNPVLNEENKIVRWEKGFRFVVDQDTGSDIKGPGRGDLFFGIGQRPGIMAGNFKEWGEVYYLIKK